jgi:AraC-like DNA-binding protein
VDVLSPYDIAAGPEENIILLLSSGRAEITCDQAVSPLNMEGIAVLGRNIAVTVESKSAQPCQIMILRLGTVDRPPYIDLNHLCLTIPIIDAFFSYKQRFSVLQDRGSIRPTFNAVIEEISRREPEWEKMTALRLQELLIQLARSFHTHDHPAGTQLLSAARDYIRAHYNEELTVGKIAAHVGISRSYPAQLFSDYLDYSTVDYIQAVRCDHAAYLLRATRFTVFDIALNVGFNSRQHFTRTFIKNYSVTPMQYRKQQRSNTRA